jgi:hypothetical protein
LPINHILGGFKRQNVIDVTPKEKENRYKINKAQEFLNKIIKVVAHIKRKER